MVHLKTINPNTRLRYVLKRERELPAEEQTVWVLRPLTSLDHLEIYAKQGAAHAVEQLRRALVNVDNLRGEGGADGKIAFTVDADGYASRALLERIPLDDLLELAGERSSAETITTDDAGKS
jgi:hypothetical protein